MNIININKQYHNEVNVGNMINGYVGSYVHHDGLQASMIRLSCDTDFCSRSKEFRDFANILAQNLVIYKSNTLDNFLDCPLLSSNHSDDLMSISYHLNELRDLFKEDIEIESFVVYF